MNPSIACEDLQLAAELGKTLLERNHELEENTRRLQAVIEHQSQEIEVCGWLHALRCSNALYFTALDQAIIRESLN